ncbi:hypothetical protein [Dyadobacter beijingensis]|uniref:hypothetical protein n=1 Tax=Dyadobacter beijingensis TaxID=365489 RepID=UPI0012FCE2DC|nr:hypothetical protein [Dyadobacter beijingensis]
MSQILTTKSFDFANNSAGVWRINALTWYNLRVPAGLGNGVAYGWWHALGFVKCLIHSSRMFVIVNPAAPLSAQCSTFLNNNQIKNGQVKPKSDCLG